MKKIIFFAAIFLIISCERQLDSEEDIMFETPSLKSITVVGDDRYVLPSGDISGVIDANNIEQALNEVKLNGGIVFLTDGDNTTTEHYYTSRNIVTNEFQGSLVGESKDNTLIHAGRKSVNEGFEPAISPWWAQTGGNPLLTTVLQFDNGIGDITIKNLSILIKDNQPTDVQPDYYGTDATYIANFIEILGGEHNTYIENIRLEGKESSDYGNILGMNVQFGIHVMLGSPITPINKKGILNVKNMEVENTGDGAVLFMRYAAESKITVEGVIGRNVGMGVWAENIFGANIKIEDNEFTINTTGFPAIFAANVPAGLNITNNFIRHPQYFGIALGDGTSNAEVVHNKFKDLNKGFVIAAVLSRGNGNSFVRNNYTKMNNSEIPAIILIPNTSKNYIHEMKFPPENGKSLCEMVWDFTDNLSTPAYDGQNEIHNYIACENLAKRKVNKAEFETGFGHKH